MIKENKFLPVEPKCTNVPYHQALIDSAADSSLIDCTHLMSNITKGTVFTSTGSVIQCPAVLERYLDIEGCNHAVQVENSKFVLFTEEIGKTTDRAEEG